MILTTDKLPSTAELEDMLLTIAMARAKGNKAKASRLLGISVRTVERRIVERIKKDEQNEKILQGLL